jgi:ABC-2 type transport system ATP-binding protein
MEKSDTVSVSGLTKYFGSEPVLRNVSFSVEAGTICGIIGRNGSGKSVLFKCLTGLYIPDSGKVRIDRDSLGALIEEPGFLLHYPGLRNLVYLMEIGGKVRRDAAEEAIRLVGLDPGDRRPVRKYSMGMRQRLGIAQAIMEDPDILILDEPMNGLDNEGVRDMRELFISLKNKGKTLLIASHSREDIGILCDKVYEMDKGRITRVR